MRVVEERQAKPSQSAIHTHTLLSRSSFSLLTQHTHTHWKAHQLQNQWQKRRWHVTILILLRGQEEIQAATRSESDVFWLEIHYQKWNHKLAENHWYLFNLVESITKEKFTITNAIDDSKNPSKSPVTGLWHKFQTKLTEFQTKNNGFFLLMMSIIPFCYQKMAQNLFFFS